MGRHPILLDAIGWILWAIVVWLAVGSLYHFFEASGGLMAGTMSTLINQWILVGWSLVFPEFDKLHLAWLGPLSYFWGVPTMFVFAFIKQAWLWSAVAINVSLLAWLT